MADRIFLSGPFTGAVPIVRAVIKAVFERVGIEVLEKHGGVDETAASLIDRSDAVVFVLGATAPAIADVWGRSLVELELSYAKYRRRPIVPVLLRVEDESALPPAVAGMRANIKRQVGDKLLMVDSIVDVQGSGAARPTEVELAGAVELLNSVVRVGWRRFSVMLASNKVFLSHSHVDKPNVERIFDELLRHEMDPWIDRYQVTAGADLAASIRRAIEASGALLVLLSKASVQSSWVLEEVRQALAIEMAHAVDSGKFIIPVRLEPVDLPDTLAFLQERLYVDLFGGAAQFQAGIRRIVHALRAANTPNPYLD